MAFAFTPTLAMNTAEKTARKLHDLADADRAAILQRFFKTGPGQYGEGDRFLGVVVPATRAVVRNHRHEAQITDVDALTASPWHEIRLAGFLMLIEIYRRQKTDDNRRAAVDFYLSILDRGNNWDLVDLVAPKILGDWIVRNPSEAAILDELAAMDGHLWHQRVAIVATMAPVRKGRHDDTLRIAGKLLDHPHDLIHKATGWLLREVGKHGGMELLLEFLDNHAAEMPRTMLRYAIERLPDTQRRHYLTLPRTKTKKG